MVIVDKKSFFLGVGMLAGFLVVLGVMFAPILDGKNALQYSDLLYNAISKGSAYYVPLAHEKVAEFGGESISMTLVMDDGRQAEQTAQLFKAGGAEVVVAGSELKIDGDLSEIMENSLSDADAMYHNDGEKVARKYGYDERQVLYGWWKTLNEMETTLTSLKRFQAARMVALVRNKVVEPAYNYYGIEPQNLTDRLGIVAFSLLFYVIYTVWYGFAIMSLFEGFGLRFGH
jgi:hypothetical protein